MVPALIDRADTLSAIGDRATRTSRIASFSIGPAFEMGRHIIGYEVQKVLAAVDWFAQPPKSARASQPRPIGVAGYGEGGLLALYAAALDPRIDAALVSGYFDSRQDLWQEPIYRNVFGLLDQFGDAELASLVAPRALIVEACRVPAGRRPAGSRATAQQLGRAGPPDDARRWQTCKPRSTGPNELIDGSGSQPRRSQLVASGDGNGPPGSAGRAGSVSGCACDSECASSRRCRPPPRDVAPADFDAARPAEAAVRPDQRRHAAAAARERIRPRPSSGPRPTAARAISTSGRASTKAYREHFYDEVIGRFDQPPLPANPRSRQVYDEPKYTGYEVVLDVFPDVFAYGILLVPKDIKPGEQRPVVVCQHGLEGRPHGRGRPAEGQPGLQPVCLPAGRARLHHLRAAEPVHLPGPLPHACSARPTRWARRCSRSSCRSTSRSSTGWRRCRMVDPERIAFYGLSYGGKTAMRVPPLVERLLPVDLLGRLQRVDLEERLDPHARTATCARGEYEIFEFDLGNTFNYAEMAALIAPRPFMVERGHYDGVAPDEWVAYEYAKVRLLYADLKIPERTTIEFFDGPHTIHGEGTFEFLHKHLNWPAS